MKPSPDPYNVEDTKWMSTKQLQETALQPSREWIDAGTGAKGVCYVEVIGCDDLPNMEVSLNKEDKTDAFVSFVYEDVNVTTDIIDDSLKPRWMPWSQRAFAFRMIYSTSVLFLGVFDYDMVRRTELYEVIFSTDLHICCIQLNRWEVMILLET